MKIIEDGKKIVVVTINEIIFYDSNLVLKHRELHNEPDIYDLQASPDGSLVAVIGNMKVIIWDADTYRQVLFPKLTEITKKCKFSYDNKFFGILYDMVI